MTWPTELGGGGRSYLERLVVTEELLSAGAPVAAHWFADRQIGPSLLRHGSSQLQDEFLRPIMRAEVFFAIGMSESEAGSDLAAVRTTAVRDGSEWRVSGTKIWTSQAHRATHVYALVRTGADSQDRHAGLSEIILDLDAPGVTVRPILDQRGEHHFNEVHFDGARAPLHRLVGESGEGWRQVTEQLSFERGGPERFLSTFPLLEAVVERCRKESVPGAFSALGALFARLVALRAQAWELAEAMERGEAPALAAAALKVAGPEFERDVIRVARELFPNDPPDPADPGFAGHLADAVLASPTFSLRGGATEVLLDLVGREMVR